jgi:ABC-type bacteriocin/lantibiotic exporter with double-glycine peptidase domain
MLMILSSFAEVVSIGAVLPFLGVLTAPDRVFEHPAAQHVIQALALTAPEQLLLPLTTIFCLSAVVAGAMRMLLLWASTHLSFSTGADLSISIYRRTLYQPYATHVARNSSSVISGISTKARAVVNSVIVPVFTLISAGFMLTAILIALLSISPAIALIAFAGFGAIYATIIRLTSNRLRMDSECVAQQSTHIVKSLQEGLGGIRDVLIDGSQAIYCQIYRNADLPLRRAQSRVAFISQGPRYVMETLGMLLIAGLAYAIAQQPDGLAQAIPVLGALALGAQRLLPVLQQAYAGWSTIQGWQGSLRDTLELLDQPLPDYVGQPAAKPLAFHEQINLKQISFRYSPTTPWILNSINLSIARGSRVGFIGTTGSGKSTLLDITMGLLQPTEGTLEIDDQPITAANHRSWQAHIAHVPQTIFLTDSTVEENIAFGQSKGQIDQDRVRKVARLAQIADVIEAWPLQYQTTIGERGIRLSGGQRQRIGIARAIYKQADVIIFDEATSALDNETEQAVMQAIEGLSENFTILIIAHRLTTLKNCTQIVELANGEIRRVGSYQKIVTDAT